MFRFLHAADLHLDSPLKGLERYEGAPAATIRGATRRALDNLVELALREQVDFVLLAGDLYDGDWRDHNTGLYFVAQMSRLREADIPVIAISGNHDAANKITLTLPLPDNCEVLPHARPGSATSSRLEALGVAVHGQSFGKAAEFDNLAAAYPSRRAGWFNIGLLHTSLAGAEGHEPYAPCTAADLRAKEYQYWALGHIHQRQVVGEAPHIVFPGNTQGRNIRETGAKGCYLVAVNDRGTVQLDFRPLDVFRWELVELDAAEFERGDDLLDRFVEQLSHLVGDHDGRPLGVRVVVAGRSAAHEQLAAAPLDWTNRIRAKAIDAGDDSVWVEQVRIRTSPLRSGPDVSTASGPLAELAACFAELRGDDELLAGFAREWNELRKKLPDDLLTGDDALRLDDLQWLRGLLDEVEPLLTSRLQTETSR